MVSNIYMYHPGTDNLKYCCRLYRYDLTQSYDLPYKPKLNKFIRRDERDMESNALLVHTNLPIVFFHLVN